MSDHSNIEWCDASWNPIVGCSIVSPGCTNCYAMSMAARIDKMTLSSHYEGLTEKVKDKTVWTGKVALANDHIFGAPLRWKQPKRIFVNSMGDLFHESIPDEWIDRVFAVMADCPHHTFQVLTKRADRMREYLSNPDLEDRLTEAWCGDDPNTQTWNLLLPLPNVWLGVSAERQQEADERIPMLLDTPAAVRFVSAEPLLGPIDFNRLPRQPDEEDRKMPGFVEIDRFTVSALCGDRGIRMKYGTEYFTGPDATASTLDWIITGGESGPNARPMNPQWPRDIRDQCDCAQVAFFHKQNGEYVSVSEVEGAGAHFTFDDGRTVRRIGKKRAGRLLDGVEHSAFPEPRA